MSAVDPAALARAQADPIGAAVLALHAPYRPDLPDCDHCSDHFAIPWPCPTVLAVLEAVPAPTVPPEKPPCPCGHPVAQHAGLGGYGRCLIRRRDLVVSDCDCARFGDVPTVAAP